MNQTALSYDHQLSLLTVSSAAGFTQLPADAAHARALAAVLGAPLTERRAPEGARR